MHNHHGGFRAEFVNNYIREVVTRPKRTDGVLLKDEFTAKSTDQLALSVASITNLFQTDSVGNASQMSGS